MVAGCISDGWHLGCSSYGAPHTATARDALCPNGHAHGKMA